MPTTLSSSVDISTRDRDGINKTFSGLMKILFPHGEAQPRKRSRRSCEFAIEGRKRVKDQLMRIDTTYAPVRFGYQGPQGEAPAVVKTAEEKKYPQHYYLKPKPAQEAAKPLPEQEASNDGEFPADSERKASVVELVQMGESDTLEFKSTLQWDTHQNKKNKELHGPSLRTIDAFLNSAGGTLLIGVDDDGEILGLEPDLKIMGGSKDKFANLLASLITEYIGAEFSMNIKIAITEAGDREVCRVDVEQSSAPAYYKGDKGREMYTRFGPTNRRLDAEETVAYIKSRW